MKIDGRHYRTIWPGEDPATITIIDQTRFPHRFETVTLRSVEDAAIAIRAGLARGASLVGATAAYGLALAMARDPRDEALAIAYDALLAAQPKAAALRRTLDRARLALASLEQEARFDAAWALAAAIAEEDVAINEAIGDHGLPIVAQLAAAKRGRVDILTHGNAGWLATVDWGTATAPIYKAFEAGIDIHVWVGETRPGNEGASLTAWELGRHGVPHTVIPDSSSGQLMQHRRVDMVLVGTDRTTARGDVCNTVGTYLKALAAHDNGVPFYVALPSPIIDFTVENGMRDIPIEERAIDEMATITGVTERGLIEAVRIVPDGTPVASSACDVTPARLVTGLITERGVCAATRDGLAVMFPDQAKEAA